MRKTKQITAVTLACILAVNGAPNYAAAKDSGVVSIKISNVTYNQLVLKKKQAFKLKVKVNKNGKASSKVSFKSSNKDVASVTAAGKIVAKKKGTAVISASSIADAKKTAKIKVTVGTPITKVSLDKKEIDGLVGEKVTLKTTINPKGASIKAVDYKSSNSSVATVSKKGIVTLKKAGNTKVTVVAKDGSNKKAECKVTVSKLNTNGSDLSYKGYNLKWSDDFSGTKLNKNDWNIETHEPGWVNEELQEYTTSEKNTYVKDGKLVIKPIKTVDKKGNVSYTSGRVNTQNKHDFKYGIFEAVAKVPEGKGFLPAFWMMPTNENLYGQWPRCGEIDIMEVLGDKTDTCHGTIHYGNPHAQSQGTYQLKSDDYSKGYHKFSCEWLPGKINWYVDGVLYHTESDWYSRTEGQGEITYPAPFDQPFYMILNLAVGGSWVGYPDETTDIDNASLKIDSVKVYQKDSYDDNNVTKPEKVVNLREPDANGNYINNANFAEAEDLTDEKDWKFLTALEGEATASIADNALTMKTTNAGTVDYSVQLVQPDLPMKKGATYELTFDAKASENRTMKVDVSAPDRGYSRYLADTKVELTPEKQSYTYTFTMKDDDDANGRLEYNLGNMGSTADVTISNVCLKKVSEAEIKEDKKALADGNYVYNGSFQEGVNRLGYWDITNDCDANVSVTNINNDRRLKVEATKCTKADDVTVGQKDLALVGGTEYMLSFDAEGDTEKEITVTVAGQDFTAKLSKDQQSYSFVMTTPEKLTNKDILFKLGTNGVTYLDNVRLVENTLIKNGSFTAGFSGYEVYAYTPDDVSYVVDSQSEDNAADITIKNTGDQDWHIQLKQNNVVLEKNQWYHLKLSAKSSLARKMMIAIQRDGSADNDWTPYIQKTVDLANDYQTFEYDFQMEHDTDLKSILSISLGAVDGKQITEQHRVCIDNISLEKINAPK